MKYQQDELSRRQAVVKNVLANAKTRNIAPLTSADLVHMARASVAESTFGALQSDQPPASAEEERAAFERAGAEEVAESTEG